MGGNPRGKRELQTTRELLLFFNRPPGRGRAFLTRPVIESRRIIIVFYKLSSLYRLREDLAEVNPSNMNLEPNRL